MYLQLRMYTKSYKLCICICKYAYTYIHVYTNLSLIIHKGLSTFIKTSLKVGIVGLLAIIVLYFLLYGIISVFTKSNGTGGEFNE